MRRTSGRTRLAAAVAALLAAGAVTGVVIARSGGPGENPSSTTGSASDLPEKPTIVFLLTDDQRWDTMFAMPTTRRDIASHGVTFSNGFVVNPLCCPSRASILTGRYSHSTGVWKNSMPYGGFEAFHDQSTLATWLHDGGYKTGLFGKYLNGYGGAYVPPGWDRWVADSGPDAYYDYDLNVDGDVLHRGTAPADYSTDVLTDYAVDFIHGTQGPLFVYWAAHNPHARPVAAPRDAHAADFPPWMQPPSFDEPDVSDKPAWVRRLPLLSKDRVLALAHQRLDQLRSLRSADRDVGRIVDALRDTGRLSTTFIVFLSDNGLAWGEHRWDRKQVAYEESIRVPFMVRFDPLTSTPRTDPHLVLNVDLAPTAAALAGVAAPGHEGASLLRLLQSPPASWRTDFLVEHLRLTRVPSFCGLRTERYLFVVYQRKEEELYDLRQDPYELDNRAADPTMAPIRQALYDRTKNLCRPPPGWSGPP